MEFAAEAVELPAEDAGLLVDEADVGLDALDVFFSLFYLAAEGGEGLELCAHVFLCGAEEFFFLGYLLLEFCALVLEGAYGGARPWRRRGRGWRGRRLGR